MEAPRILVVKGKAGMGNRLRFLAHAFVYAIASRRVLVIDWSDPTYSNDGQNVFQEYFEPDNLSLLEVELESLNGIEVVPNIWDGYLDYPVSEMKGMINKAINQRIRENLLSGPLWNDFDNPAPIQVVWAYNQHLKRIPPALLSRVIGKKSSREILIWFFQEILTLNWVLRQRIESFVAKNPSMIGVHVRQSDKKTTHPLSTSFEKIDRLDDSHSIFLATDNLQIFEQFVKRYGNRVISTPKWYPSPGASCHQNKQCPDRLENGKEALVDIYILSQCKFLLRQKDSSFTEISDYIAGRQSEFWNV